jgi:hypothetical protein
LVYDNEEEMNAVVGKLGDNSFIIDQSEELEKFKNKVASLKRLLERKEAVNV